MSLSKRITNALASRVLGLMERVSAQVVSAAEGVSRTSGGAGRMGLPVDGFSQKLIGRFHRLGHGILRGQGFTFQAQHSGATRVGIWKKVLKETAASATPKRLVVVPGLGDAAVSWLPVLSALRVVLRGQVDEICILEFPGYMGSLREEAPIDSFDRMIEHASDVLDHLKPHTLIGHSLGGWISTHYALACGEKRRPLHRAMGYEGPERVILMAPPGIERDPEKVKVWGEIFFKATELGYEFLRPHTFGKEPKWFGFIVPSLESFFRRKEMHDFVRSIKDDHFVGTDRLKCLTAEVWLLFAEHDTLAQVHELDDWLKALAPIAPRAHGVVIRGIGHSPHIEAPVVTAAILGQILRSRKLSDRGRRWWEIRSVA